MQSAPYDINCTRRYTHNARILLIFPMRFLHSSIAAPAIVQLQKPPHVRANSKRNHKQEATQMAHATDFGARAHFSLGASFKTLMTEFSARRAKRKIFNQTRRELASLSNRELADLGIARSEISRISHEAAELG